MKTVPRLILCRSFCNVYIFHQCVSCASYINIIGPCRAVETFGLLIFHFFFLPTEPCFQEIGPHTTDHSGEILG